MIFFEKFLNLIRSIIDSFDKWRSYKKEYNHFKKLSGNIERTQLISKTIVFNTVRSIKSVIDREFFLGKILALNGAKVIVLLDDGILKHCDTITLGKYIKYKNFKKTNFNPTPFSYKNYKNFVKNLLLRSLLKQSLKSFQDKNLKFIYYSEILTKKKINFENWQELKKYAHSSTIRFFTRSNLDFNNRYVKHYYNLSLINAIMSKNVGEYILKRIKPDFFITSHGIYSTWGPTYDFLKKHGINCLVYSGVHGHSTKEKDFFIIDQKPHLLSSSKFWQKFKHNRVTKEMKEKVMDYFEKRFNYNSRDGKWLYYGKKTILKINKNDGYKYHVAMFPHLLWDGNIKDRHPVFSGYLDWLLSTIDFLKNRKDIKLYVKSHPIELRLKNSTRVVDLIKKYIELEEIDNLVLIPPETKLDTYLFLKSGVDLSLVYDGFLGIEIPFLRIPTITCVKGGFASVEGGNITIRDKESYFEYLNNIDKINTEFNENYDERLNNLIKYVYWYIFEISIKLPTLSSDSYIGTNLLQLKRKDLIIDNKFLSFFT